MVKVGRMLELNMFLERCKLELVGYKLELEGCMLVVGVHSLPVCMLGLVCTLGVGCKMTLEHCRLVQGRCRLEQALVYMMVHCKLELEHCMWGLVCMRGHYKLEHCR